MKPDCWAPLSGLVSLRGSRKRGIFTRLPGEADAGLGTTLREPLFQSRELVGGRE